MERIGAGMTLLIVDDDRDLLPSLVDTVEMLSDFTVITAENGAQALESVAQTPPHCIVIDARMPVIDGFQLVRLLRGDRATAHIPLIMLTAIGREASQFTGLASGADRYLIKPVRARDLIAAIGEALAISEEERKQRLLTLAESDDDPPPQT